MSVYQTIPETINAVFWDTSNLEEIKAFLGENYECEVVECDEIMVIESDDEVSIILPNQYVIKFGITYGTMDKDKFEKAYGLVSKDLFFYRIPIIIQKGVAYENSGSTDYWSVLIPKEFDSFEPSFHSKIAFEDANRMTTVDIDLKTFDVDKCDYVSLDDAKIIAEYIRNVLRDYEDWEIVILN